MQKTDNKNLKNVAITLKPKRQLFLFLIGSIGLTIISLIGQTLIQFIVRGVAKTDYDYEVFMSSSLMGMILNGSAYLILAIIYIVSLRNDSDELFKSFKKWQPYIAGAIGFCAIIAFNLIYNLILSVAGISINDNNNESSLNSIVTSFPLASILMFAIIGPTCEELCYRVGLFSLTKRINRFFGYFVTIVVFSLIHFDFTSVTIINELLNIPFYSFAALVLTYLYDNYGLAGSLSAHITNNLFSIITTILGIIR